MEITQYTSSVRPICVVCGLTIEAKPDAFGIVAWPVDNQGPKHWECLRASGRLASDRQGMRGAAMEPTNLTPDRFYLICERREDGGLRVTSPEVPGLVLSHADPQKVMRDVIPAIDAIERHNLLVELRK